MTKLIKWGDPQEPNEDCHYDHLRGETSFGNILITWKSWKKHDSFLIEEPPWLGFASCPTLEGAKSHSESEFERLLTIAMAGVGEEG
jgi:hypothetical protein